MIQKLGLRQPDNITVRSVDAAVEAASKIGYPLVVRPPYVLGGRAMEIVYREEDLLRYMRDAVKVSAEFSGAADRFLSAAIEVDIDAVSDGKQVVIGAIMQHIEQAGCIPATRPVRCRLQPGRESPGRNARAGAADGTGAGVVGLMNVQLAWQDGETYVIEVNPGPPARCRSSPCIGVSWPRWPPAVWSGRALSRRALPARWSRRTSASKAVLPFNKFPGWIPSWGRRCAPPAR